LFLTAAPRVSGGGRAGIDTGVPCAESALAATIIE